MYFFFFLVPSGDNCCLTGYLMMGILKSLIRCTYVRLGNDKILQKNSSISKRGATIDMWLTLSKLVARDLPTSI